MFAFDQSSLPQLTTRKALILVDFQNDFLEPDGALPVTEPEGFLDRALELVAAFRASGDVVWVQSRFQEPRSTDSEQIVTSDALPVRSRSSRSQRSRAAASQSPVDDGAAPDPEAFLSHPEPICLKPSSPGVDAPAAVQNAVQKSDISLTKTHYSAFQDTHLLRMLRAKMVMDVFICGSLANVGVYATALGAAGHGLSITIVENCCGHRSEIRQMNAIKALLDLTGCEVASASEVLESITPKKPGPPIQSTKPKSRRSRPEQADSSSDARPSMSPDIVRPMTSLRLASDSPAPGGSSNTSSSVADQGDAKPTDSKDSKEDVTEAVNESHEKSLTKPQVDSPATGENSQAIKPDVAAADAEPLKEPPAEEEEEEVTANEPIQAPSKISAKTPDEPSTEAPATSPAEPSTEALPKESSPNEDPLPPREKGTTGDPAVDDVTAETQQKGLCAGDTDVIENLLPASLEKDIFYTLKDEVRWQRMSHQGGEVPRLVAVQGEIAEDGSMPVYRHPSDESPPLLPFSPTVLAIKAETEKHLGHPLNHVLIQYYRGGSDYISEHSDKTLDIVRSSYIANVSLGAERIMVLRTKRGDKDHSRPASSTASEGEGAKRKIQRARLPHNSLCRMGLQTNMQWLHAIRQDKRADKDKTPSELAYEGGRISLTFRQIGTYLDRDETIIWGQGATGKTREEAHPVINGQEPAAIEMLRAFGTENHASAFDWDAHYGKGFDVLHIRAAPRFFASGDKVVDMRISMMLAECGVGYAKGSMAPSTSNETVGDSKEADSATSHSVIPVKFADNDTGKSVVQGDVAIMIYLNTVYGPGKASASPADRLELAMQLTRFQQGLSLLDKWRHLPKEPPVAAAESKEEKTEEASTKTSDRLKHLRRELATWDGYATEFDSGFLAGSSLSLPDFAVWPVLHAMVQEHGEATWNGLDNLRKYYDAVKRRETMQKVLGRPAEEEQKAA